MGSKVSLARRTVAKKILFAADFSESCEPCLAYASELARLTGGTMIIAHVEDTGRATGEAQLYEGIPEPGLPPQELLDALAPPDPNVRVERLLLKGKPAEELVIAAEAHGADLIVMGTHGRRGFRRWIMGSVAEEVVRKSTCPVLTYRQVPAQ